MEYISEGKIKLPEFLYYYSCEASKSTSPAARFDPIAATTGDAWQNSTAPSQQPNKKILILTKDSFQEPLFDYGQSLAIIARLKNAGFRIFFKNIIGDFTEINKDLGNLVLSEDRPDFLNNFGSKAGSKDQGKIDDDYKQLATLNITRDQTIFLTAENIYHIEASLKQQNTGACYLQGNGLEFSFSLYDPESETKITAEEAPIITRFSALSEQTVKNLLKTIESIDDPIIKLQAIRGLIEFGYLQEDNSQIVDDLLLIIKEIIEEFSREENSTEDYNGEEILDKFNKLFLSIEENINTISNRVEETIQESGINPLARAAILKGTKYETIAIKHIKEFLKNSINDNYNNQHIPNLPILLIEKIIDYIVPSYRKCAELEELLNSSYEIFTKKANPETVLKDFILKIGKDFPEYAKPLLIEFIEDKINILIEYTRSLDTSKAIDIIKLLHEIGRGDVIDRILNQPEIMDFSKLKDFIDQIPEEQRTKYLNNVINDFNSKIPNLLEQDLDDETISRAIQTLGQISHYIESPLLEDKTKTLLNKALKNNIDASNCASLLRGTNFEKLIDEILLPYFTNTSDSINDIKEQTEEIKEITSRNLPYQGGYLSTIHEILCMHIESYITLFADIVKETKYEDRIINELRKYTEHLDNSSMLSILSSCSNSRIFGELLYLLQEQQREITWKDIETFSNALIYIQYKIQTKNPEDIEGIVDNQILGLLISTSHYDSEKQGFNDKFYKILALLNAAGAEYAEIAQKLLIKALLLCKDNASIKIDLVKIIEELGVASLHDQALSLILEIGETGTLDKLSDILSGDYTRSTIDYTRSTINIFNLPGIEALIGRYFRYQNPAYTLINFQEGRESALKCLPDHIKRTLCAIDYARYQNQEILPSKYIEQNPTYLHIISLSSRQQIKELEKFKTELNNVVALDIIDVKKPELLLELLKLLPNLKYLNLPNSIKQQASRIFSQRESELPQNLYVKYAEDYKKYYVAPLANKTGRNSGVQQAGNYSASQFYNTTQQFAEQHRTEEKHGSAHGSAQSNPGDLIKIAVGNKLGTNQVAETGPSSGFNMAIAGRILNRNNDRNIESSARDRIIQFKDIKTNTEWEIAKATNFVEIASSQYRILTTDAIEKFEKEDNKKNIYYEFKYRLPNNGWHKLPSAAATEELIGITTDPSGAEIRFKKGNDDFIYAYSEASCTLTYVTKVVRINHYSFLPINHPAKKIITEYLNKPENPNPYEIHKEEYKYKDEYKHDPKKHQQWLKTIFDKKIGACRHRVAAVTYILIENGVDPKHLRTVGINGNHVKIEIFYNGKWFFLPELGGERAELIDLPKDTTYSAQAVEIEATGTQIEKNNGQSNQESLEDKDSLEHIEYLEHREYLENIESFEQKESKPKSFVERLTPRVHNTSIIGPLLAKKAAITINDAKLLELVSTQPEHTARNPVRNIESNTAKKQGKTHNRILLTTGDELDNVANRLLQIAKEQNRLVYYIDSKSKINLNTKTVTIRAKNIDEYSTSIEDHGTLLDFLKGAQTGGALLIINWSAFSAKDRVKLNTLLDASQPTINSQNLPNNTQIVSLSKQNETDRSFLSRHSYKARTGNIKPREITNLHSRERKLVDRDKSTNKEKYDLAGLVNWQAALFGEIFLKNNEIIWQQSDFTKDLLKGKIKNFELHNLSQTAKQEFLYLYNQAKSMGEFNYHGFRISIAADTHISCSDKDFDFSKFKLAEHYADTSLEQTPPGTILINSLLFDQLLHGKQIKDTKYSEIQGLFKQRRGKELSLFITQELSASQYYCLFFMAQQYVIKLVIHTAKNVQLPEAIQTHKIVKPKTELAKTNLATTANIFSLQPPPASRQGNTGQKNTSKGNNCQINVSNNPDLTLDKIQKQHGAAFAVLAIEDYTYQDLINAINFKISSNKFCDFSSKTSQLLELLSASSEDDETKESKTQLGNRKIILKGQFSPELLTLLQPIIAGIPPYEEVAKKLIFLIEDAGTPNLNNTYPPLQWLNNKNYEIEQYAAVVTEEPQKIFETIQDAAILDANSKEKADDFIKKRKELLFAALENNSMVQLVGHSGVGKSRLMKILHDENRDTHTIYTELDSLANWANDNKDNKKTKLLFIDEANIEDQHLTIFEPLKKGDNRRILYKGNFYNLSPQHKIVFARNPIEYGGRVAQKLFKDGSIPEIHFKDFPACYIYEKILKEAIYDKLANDIKQELGEHEFKTQAIIFINDYLDKNQNNPETVTVRELQESMLNFIAKYIAEKFQPVAKSELKHDGFIETDATKATIASLKNAINIRTMQREGNLPNEAVGLNAMIIEGDAGIGKSAMIKAVLHKENIKPALPELKTSNAEKIIPETEHKDQATIQSGYQYYKIDANLSFDEKKKIIIKAFNEGNIVWLDEINCCTGDDNENRLLEKVLNAVLTGEHPDTKEKSKNPGFMLISSINQIFEAGRSALSPALMHRSNYTKAKSLHEYSVKDFEDILSFWYGKILTTVLNEMNLNTLQRTIKAKAFRNELHIPERIHGKATEIYEALQKDENHKKFDLRDLGDSAKDYFKGVIENAMSSFKPRQVA